MSSKTKPIHENKAKNIPSEPEYITAECVRQKKMANAASHAGQQNSNLHSNNGNQLEVQLFGSVLVILCFLKYIYLTYNRFAFIGSPSKRTDSPDNDSAFCDNISSNSGNGSNGCTDSTSAKVSNQSGD